ncbi:peroxidase [Staphylococcus saprophyticus]|jgi:thiol peroxidase|uniref:Thiol peroxidase n=2 Tax=Staphylococcus saprophyticus TaxID=29385 RepID=TPX_STAS1|nr:MULTISPECIES: thiol peroxidase [Staphylococcus]Q49YE4.1 RecName: Full=Thiol peroxidase; Short=Tpx; AltName: Full=Peroxiredoxin tpx; Short=Prx; AltName: Full=Thioredoxin peroxidase; AltName: Full=Thioredoxin-dependent peroxiredoxin [Staphylococcus saprophyticus subsp. saprophyticus ATCC 15305 = NCTC 7292]CRV15843.1 lipid hydroperoxide peroxidase [Streptococcus equi subsp. equi]AMG20169.1 2-Cys peroxiredoxin [Staphylococcus saprophyticus]AMG33229.1 2-Cys peroxiredoxin [Staphylococcus saprophyt
MAQITFKQEPITLLGSQVKTGETAPEFTLLDNDLNEVNLSTYDGQKKLISVVPSIDTGVCDQQTRKFNEEASQEDGVVLTVSVDLPFAQKRWCASNGLDNVITLSDHKDLSFGKNYGVVMEELRLLARSVFVLDKNNKVVYSEIVSEGTDFPDFESALEAYRNI